MGFLFRPKELPRPASLTFTLDQAGHTYDDGHVGLAPTDITISELRVAVIGLNGAGKSTLLGLLDGSLKANAGTVTIAGGEERLDPAVKKDAKRIDNLVGKVRREEIPNSFYQAANISEAVSEALALKAAHGQLCSVTYEVTGDIPSDAGARPADAKVKKGGNYTVAPVQTTSQSRYTFSGWRINGVGDVVTEIKDIQQDVKLIGVWTRRSSGGGGGSSKPTVDIPDDVPTGLNGDDHFAYIVGYPNGNVEPNGNITRAEVATIFFRLLTEEVRTANSTQSNSLSDVTRGQWFNHAVSTLS